ncbi:MAG: hypothetical protein A2X08_03545 [Bacteroidetes bacterium GWA2_32_17]|nr:MAG: hypothetical protein A2X08_03545 [Bacteroidetes bacterium GWA2_32_17]
MKKKLLFILAVALIATNSFSQKLDKFTTDLGKKSVMGKEVRVPYTDLISYYGYIAQGAKPDEMRDGKKFYYLYLWISVAAPEVGVRMISPVPDKMVPEETDFKGSDYDQNKTDKTSYFDTWITLEKASGITSIEEISSKASGAKWNSYEQNDDSGEMPAQPSGSKYNSLMRITSSTSDPLKSLTIGLYRIGFTTYKTGEVQGSFLAQVGSPVKIPGVMIAKDIETLVKMLTEKK